MGDGTTLLFDLPGFGVVDCVEAGGTRRVVVMQDQDVHACPACGVVAAGVPYDHRDMRFRDVPFGPRPLVTVWRKRRFRCVEPSCERRVFTETSVQLPPRCRVTGRLREQLERSASRSARALLDVAREYGVSWWTVNDALARKAATLLAPPAPTGMLGIDETRARSVRWLLDRAGWRRSDPWMTSFVDRDPTHRAGLVGLAPGRSGATVNAWLAAQPESWRDGVRLVAIDRAARRPGNAASAPARRPDRPHRHRHGRRRGRRVYARGAIRHEPHPTRGSSTERRSAFYGARRRRAMAPLTLVKKPPTSTCLAPDCPSPGIDVESPLPAQDSTPATVSLSDGTLI